MTHAQVPADSSKATEDSKPPCLGRMGKVDSLVADTRDRRDLQAELGSPSEEELALVAELEVVVQWGMR